MARQAHVEKMFECRQMLFLRRDREGEFFKIRPDQFWGDLLQRQAQLVNVGQKPMYRALVGNAGVDVMQLAEEKLFVSESGIRTGLDNHGRQPGVRCPDQLPLTEGYYTAGTVVTESPDPKDNMILATALAGRAELIVSGDKRHVLSLGNFRGIPIVTPAAALLKIGIWSAWAALLVVT